MGGCSGRILTFAYAETFHFSVALKPLHFGGARRAAQEPLSWRGSLPAGADPAGTVLPLAASWGRNEEKLLTD